jgi:hypothetical protein
LQQKLETTTETGVYITMKHQFVKTENHRRFLSHVAMLENRGATERCILAVIGEPGTGKTRTTDNWGSLNDAVFIEGVAGMNLPYITAALKAETGISEKNGFDLFRALTSFFTNDGKPRAIILDECQHGFTHKAEVIEYLRALAAKAKTILILVCHSSESSILQKHKHIKDRIGGICQLETLSLEDTALYAGELCEVGLDDTLIAEVHQQGEARYRLITDALANLERIAGKLGKSSLTLTDVAGVSLCQDWEKVLKRKGLESNAARSKGGK